MWCSFSVWKDITGVAATHADLVRGFAAPIRRSEPEDCRPWPRRKTYKHQHATLA